MPLRRAMARGRVSVAGGRRRDVEHLPVAVERGEVERDVGAKPLHDPRRRVIDVALELGYFDPAHFTRAFVRLTGVAPRQFRQRRATAYSGVPGSRLPSWRSRCPGTRVRGTCLATGPPNAYENANRFPSGNHTPWLVSSRQSATWTASPP